MTRHLRLFHCRPKAWTVLCACLAFSARHVFAAPPDPQDLSGLSLEDLMRIHVEQVFGAAKRLQPATEAPSSVSIVTAADIARYGYRTLADILRGVRGLYVTYDRNYSYLGARGFAQPGDYNTRILLLVDGHRMNDDVFDQAAIGPELGLDVDTFERVEIIRGPASALYGTSAFFAVVSVTTRRGAAINGITAATEGGTFGTWRGRAAAGAKFGNGVDAVLTGHVEGTGGPQDLFFPAYDSTNTNNGHAIGLDGERARGMAGRLSFKDFSMSGAYGWRRKVVPTAAFDTVFNDDRFETIDERSFVDAGYDHKVRGALLAIRGYADQYNYDGRYPYASLVDGMPPIMSTDYGHGVWWGTDVRATRTLPGVQTVIGGFEYRDYLEQNQGEQYDDNRLPAFTTDVSTRVLAAYGQDEIRLKTRWLVTLGGRYDSYSGFGQFSPRASIVFAATPARSFKYLFGHAFRAPNAYEFDYLSGGMRNRTLRAENLVTNEAAWEEYRGGWLRTSVSAYRNRADRLITLMGDDYASLAYTNLGRVLARGVELETEMKSQTGLLLLASYAWQRAEDRDTGLPLVDSPEHLAKIRFGSNGFAAGSTLGLELQAMSARHLVSGGTVGAYAVCNANYVQAVGARLKLVATVRNVLDTAYADPASEEHAEDVIPQDGRTFWIGVEWSQKRR